MLFHGKDCCFHYKRSLVACSPSYTGSFMSFLHPSTLLCLLVSPLCCSCVQFLIFLGDTISQQTSFPFLWMLRSFWSLFWNDSRASGRAVVLWIYQFEPGSTTLRFVQLLHLIFWDRVSHWTWSSWLGSLTHWPARSSDLWPTCLHLTGAGVPCTTLSGYHMRAGLQTQAIILVRQAFCRGLHLPPHTVKEFSQRHMRSASY